jgi:hypothetical protein
VAVASPDRKSERIQSKTHRNASLKPKNSRGIIGINTNH